MLFGFDKASNYKILRFQKLKGRIKLLDFLGNVLSEAVRGLFEPCNSTVQSGSRISPISFQDKSRFTHNWVSDRVGSDLHMAVVPQLGFKQVQKGMAHTLDFKHKLAFLVLDNIDIHDIMRTSFILKSFAFKYLVTAIAGPSELHASIALYARKSLAMRVL